MASRPSPSPSASPTETPSSVQKACRILRAMSDGRDRRLTDIALSAGLDKATALRLLDVLTREGLIVRDAATKRFELGPEACILGAAAVAHADLRSLVRPSLIRLADRFGDTAILSIPSGAESVCIDLQFGSFPIRANYLEVGSRRPLGVGAGSLALLAWMPDHEIEALLPLVSTRLERYARIDRPLIEGHIARARRDGCAVLLDAVVDRMGGIAVPILGDDARPVAAISIAALTDRIVSQQSALAAALRHEAAACQALRRRCAAGAGRPAAGRASPPRRPAPALAAAR